VKVHRLLQPSSMDMTPNLSVLAAPCFESPENCPNVLTECFTREDSACVSVLVFLLVRLCMHK